MKILMKTSIIPIIASLLVSGCTTYRVKKDDHSYTYIYQHNDNPETIQMNNRIKKPNNDVFDIPYKSNTNSSYNNAPFYDSTVIDEPQSFSADSNFRREAAPRTYTPEMNEYVSRNYDGYRRNAHNPSPYPYYTPNRPF